MSAPLITIVTVNYNSSAFIELMLYAFQRLTKHPYIVRIRDNNSSLTDYRRLEEIIKPYPNVTLYRVETPLKGSEAHGTALNEMVEKISTPYGAIMDADATFLLKHWDDILLERLNTTQPLIGTQADTLGGKPMDFPLMFALLFETKTMQRLGIDFRPKDLSKLQDTGWEMREKYTAAGYTGGLMYDQNTRFFHEGPFTPIVCSEYYLGQGAERGPIAASHFGRGSAPKAKNLVRIGGNTFIIRAINKLLSYPNQLKWAQDKGRWLRIARQIIDSQ